MPLPPAQVHHCHEVVVTFFLFFIRRATWEEFSIVFCSPRFVDRLVGIVAHTIGMIVTTSYRFDRWRSRSRYSKGNRNPGRPFLRSGEIHTSGLARAPDGLSCSEKLRRARPKPVRSERPTTRAINGQDETHATFYCVLCSFSRFDFFIGTILKIYVRTRTQTRRNIRY